MSVSWSSTDEDDDGGATDTTGRRRLEPAEVEAKKEDMKQAVVAERERTPGRGLTRSQELRQLRSSSSSSSSDDDSRALLPRPVASSSAAVNNSDDDVDCCICWDGYAPTDMRGLLDCPDNHLVCAACMERYLTGLISDASTVNQITCPASGCTAVPAAYEIEALVPADVYQKYLEFTALDSLKREKGVRWCPNKQCQQPIVWAESTPTVVCPACRTRFCFHCGRDHAEGAPCPTTTDTRQAAANDGAAGQPLDADAAYEQWRSALGKLVKPCPGCRIDIEKNAGCQHMTCANCRHQWCWLCSETYTPTHYSADDSLCRGLQFSAFDSLDDALVAQGRDRQQVLDEIRRREEERPIREAAERQRQRRKKIKQAVTLVVLSPCLVLGGALVVGGAIVALPFVGLGVLLC